MFIRALVRSDAAIAAAIFLVSAAIGSAAYVRAFRSGPRPFFYQSYFEPAVMVACGKGFLLAQPTPGPPEMRAFLNEERDRFSCDELPRDLQVGTTGLYQRPWRYLLTMVAIAWKVLGITWSGLWPLLGLLFGTTTLLAYALSRLIVGRVAAVVCAAALSVSPLQLANLPNLRDYAKAPFTLALLVILVALVVRPRRGRDVLLLALAYGVILGIGYGFRTDLLIDIPPLLIAIAFFLPGGVLRNAAVKAGAVVCFATGFLIAGWPIISTVVGSGGCQWHVALLGLTSPFDAALGVHGGSYGWGHLYNDNYVWANVTSDATRFRPDLGYIEYCSHEYDVASWDLYRRILATFPADMVTRAYASALQVVGLPFARLGSLRVAGPLLAAAFVVAAAAGSMRLALFTVLALGYFAGYPALQFHPRHYFPFEVIGWLLLVWAVERLAVGRFPETLRRGVVWTAIALLALALPLWALRAYQQRRVTALLEAYAASPTDPLVVAPPGTPRPTAMEVVADLGRGRARFIEVTAESCRPGATITFRYDPAYPETDFTTTEPLAGGGPGPTRVFEPVFETFTGVAVSDPSCVVRAATVRDADRLPLQLPVQLSSDWTSLRQYQQISVIR